MTNLRSVGLFTLAALAEIGGAYGFVATLQPFQHVGRILAAYGGVFVAGSLAWGVILDGFDPTATTSPAPPSAWSALPSSCTHHARDGLRASSAAGRARR